MSERLLVAVFYTVLVIATLWVGTHALSYFQDYRLYSAFVAPWQRGWLAFNSAGADWPPYREGRHAEYMDKVVEHFRRIAQFEPPAAGRGAFIYRLSKPGQPPDSVFLLALPEQIVIYGLSPTSLRRLDRFVDGRYDVAAGELRAILGDSGEAIAAVWQH